jgi:hypothetical protein
MKSLRKRKTSLEMTMMLRSSDIGPNARHKLLEYGLSLGTCFQVSCIFMNLIQQFDHMRIKLGTETLCRTFTLIYMTLCHIACPQLYCFAMEMISLYWVDFIVCWKFEFRSIWRARLWEQDNEPNPHWEILQQCNKKPAVDEVV